MASQEYGGHETMKISIGEWKMREKNRCDWQIGSTKPETLIRELLLELRKKIVCLKEGAKSPKIEALIFEGSYRSCFSCTTNVGQPSHLHQEKNSAMLESSSCSGYYLIYYVSILFTIFCIK